MKQRNVALVIIFGALTGGVYDIYWIYATRKEMVNLGQKIPRLIILLLPLVLLIVVAALQFIVHFVITGFPPADMNLTTSGDLTTTSLAPVASTGISDVALKAFNIFSLIAGIAATLALIPLSIYWYYKYCKAVEQVTNGQVTLGLSLGLGTLLSVFGFGFVSPGIIQDGLNKVGYTPSSGPQPTTPTTTYLQNLSL